ncbi:MAG: right-handed parallel beta-helix repeat-containing protein, partial [Saprospiraceae bacterium]|nr:right-handed parallel beta-helix repeat-containing protein [Saprospiraceae bacterium]
MYDSISALYWFTLQLIIINEKSDLLIFIRRFLTLMLLFNAFSGASGQTSCGVDNSCLLTTPVSGDWRCVNGTFTIQQLIINGTLLPAAQAATTPQHVIVNGIIIFNLSYTFATGSELVFAPSKAMSVESGKTLTIKGSHLHGCSALWNGIAVAYGGSIRLENNIIEQANTAVLMLGGASLTTYSSISALNNTFRGNNICIQLGDALSPPSPSKIVVLKNGMIGNTFDGTGNLLGGTGSPSAGIQIQNIYPVTIGSTGNSNLFTPNLFKGFVKSSPDSKGAGIYVLYSSVNIQRCRFEDIGDVAIEMSGYGIRFVGSGSQTLSIKGLGQNNFAQATFDNVCSPIVLEAASITASDIYSTTSREAIRFVPLVFSNMALSFDLRNSTFEQFDGRAAAYVKLSNTTVPHLTISGCKFYDNAEAYTPPGKGGPRCCINILAAYPTDFQKGSIHGNEFYNEGKGTQNVYNNCGVKLENTIGGFIDENVFLDSDDVAVVTAKSYQGIFLKNCQHTRMANNSIYGTSFAYGTDKTSVGIDIFESSYCNFHCNDLGYLDRAVAFRGENCDHASLNKTIMHVHNNSLYLAPDAVITPQIKQENRWHTHFGLQAYFDFPGFNSFDPLDVARVQMSAFEINDNNQNSIYWPSPRQIGNEPDNATWFQYNQLLEVPPAELNCHQCCVEIPQLSRGDEFALAGTYPPYKGYDASTWDAQFRLFDNLYHNSELRPTGSTAATFYNTNSSGSLGTLHSAWQQIIDVSRADETTLAQFNASHAALENMQAQIYAMDDQIAAATDLTEGSLLAQRDLLLDDWISENATYSTLIEDRSSGIQQAAATSLNTVTTLAVSTIWETNLKTVLEMQLSLLATGSEMDPADESSIVSVAEQCRYAGGFGVLLARSMLPDGEYNDEEACSERSALEARTGSNTELLIVPNPARDQVIVQIGESFEKAQITLYDAIGLMVCT